MNADAPLRTESGTFLSARFRLSDADLRLFEKPRSWRQIVTTPGPRNGDYDWWRDAVMEADEAGSGLLAWNGKTKRWTLSPRGRAYLRLPPEEGKTR
jgi:hypothetical protein